MAAGMTIRAEAFDAFAQGFDAVVRRRLQPVDLQAVIHSDGVVSATALSLDTARIIRDGGPWGQGFAEPLFDDRFEVLSSRIVGQRHWKLVVRPVSGGEAIDAIAFNAVDEMPAMPGTIRAAYRLDENEWQGRASLQLRMEYLEAAGSSDA